MVCSNELYVPALWASKDCFKDVGRPLVLMVASNWLWSESMYWIVSSRISDCNKKRLYYTTYLFPWNGLLLGMYYFDEKNSFCTHTLETSFFEAKVGTIVLNRRNSAFRAYLRYFLTTFWPACNCWRSICLLCDDLGGVRSSWSLFHLVTSVSQSKVTMSLVVSHWGEGPLFPPVLPISETEGEGVEEMPPPGSL